MWTMWTMWTTTGWVGSHGVGRGRTGGPSGRNSGPDQLVVDPTVVVGQPVAQRHDPAQVGHAAGGGRIVPAQPSQRLADYLQPVDDAIAQGVVQLERGEIQPRRP